MTQIAELFRQKKEESQAEEHFKDYRRLCDRTHFKNVQEALNFWAEWQEVTARLLLTDSKNKAWAAWKIEDAKQRRSEAQQIAEIAKEKRGRK